MIPSNKSVYMGLIASLVLGVGTLFLLWGVTFVFDSVVFSVFLTTLGLICFFFSIKLFIKGIKIKNAKATEAPVYQSFASKPLEEPRIERTDEEWQTHFKEILNRQFPQYIIKEDVPVTLVTGDISDVFTLYETRPNQVYRAEWGQHYNFVLYEGDKPKLAIIIGDSNSWRKVKFLISRMFAKKLNIPFLSFFKKFDNKEDYVAKRIREVLET